MKTKEKVLLAMSGGVDSFAAALILKEQGYDVEGITFIHWNKNNPGVVGSPLKPTPEQSATEAAHLCQSIGILHHTVELSSSFEEVLTYFSEAYFSGKTPNPCVYCNRHFKFRHLAAFADKWGIEKIATGHYAQVISENGRVYLQRASDDWKDQSFMLWALDQSLLKRSLFPLSTSKKDDVKKMVKEQGFPIQAACRESYNLCFVPDNDYKQFLRRRCPEKAANLHNGLIMDVSGNIIGHHDGYPFYTIGQSKGFSTSVKGKQYILSVDPLKNHIIVADKEKLFQDRIWANELHFQKYELLQGHYPLYVRIRGKDTGTKALVTFEKSKAHILFDKPVFAPAKGQSAVFYEGSDLVGGGIIC